MIFVVDYGRGNLFSIGQALRKLGVSYHISSKPEDLTKAKRIIFPGVGAFGDAMAGLRERGLVQPLRAAAQRGVPFLGICVGCQLLLTRGEEFGSNDGLDLIQGVVSRLPAPRIGDPDAIRIPNVGWRPLSVRSNAPILGEIAPEDWMYFVHSYAPMVDDPYNISATINFNGQDIPVAIWSDNIFGVQFHPERSGPSGLRVLAKFLEAKTELI